MRRIRRDNLRPDYAFGIMADFNNRGHKPARPDTVRAHNHRMTRSAFIRVIKTGGFSKLCAELENVADLNGLSGLNLVFGALGTLGADAHGGYLLILGITAFPAI